MVPWRPIEPPFLVEKGSFWELFAERLFGEPGMASLRKTQRSAVHRAWRGYFLHNGSFNERLAGGSWRMAKNKHLASRLITLYRVVLKSESESGMSCDPETQQGFVLLKQKCIFFCWCLYLSDASTKLADLYIEYLHTNLSLYVTLDHKTRVSFWNLYISWINHLALMFGLLG